MEGCIAANRIVYEVYGKEKTEHKVSILIGDRVRKVERERETKVMLEFERDRFLEYCSLLESVEHGKDVEAEWPRCLTFKQLAQKYGIFVQEIKNANDEETVAMVARMEPDVAFNLRNTMIYKAPIIEVPKLGFLNSHSGPLPNYKGLCGVMQQMFHGETEIGCALHQVDTGIDTGAVLKKNFIPLRKEKSVLWHQLMLYLKSCECFIGLLPKLEAGVHVRDMGDAQDPTVGEYYGVPSSEFLAEFKTKGFHIIVDKEMDELTSTYFLSLDKLFQKIRDIELSEAASSNLKSFENHLPRYVDPAV
eukprot:CAMPEP_0113892064 /NCGR_PEP_ID=MMETSP0780_2-20120614/15172_1 /TAXON_ID=652834 /ORGANISM="Palpitomonas bilix" /LENGTH=304 /DNA_ID=CAMNT_0000881887 /DNA_START=96 /DNA_END=1010 /DNA_ORIENTATION=+ /assembly_acc=CAM_ASM_000599